jgi:hypothetical protein
VGLTESEEVKGCNWTTAGWNTAAALTVAQDLSGVSDEWIQAFGQAVLDVYNGWGNACDPYSRTITNVTVQLKPVINVGAGNNNNISSFNDRFLQKAAMPSSSSSLAPTRVLSGAPSNSPTKAPTNSGADLFTLLFETEGTCSGCPSQTGLFDQVSAPSTTRKLSSLKQQRSLKNPVDKCVCPAGAEQRSLKVDEFLEGLKNDPKYAELVQDTLSLSEVALFECNEFSDFLAFASVDFVGNPENLTDTERGILSGGLVNTYNVVAEEFCDPLFRTLMDAKIVDVVARRDLSDEYDDTYFEDRFLQSVEATGSSSPSQTAIPSDTPSDSPTSGSSESATDAPSPSPTNRGADLFTLMFLTSGVCSGCGSESNLFDELSVRRL